MCCIHHILLLQRILVQILHHFFNVLNFQCYPLCFTENLAEPLPVFTAMSNDLSEANADESLSGVVSPNIALMPVYGQSAMEQPSKSKGKLFIL